MNSITVRQAVLADLETLVPLFDAYRQFYQQPSDLDGARAFLSERFHHQQSVLFLAFLGSQAVGFTQLYPSFSSVSMKRLFILNDLYVAQEGRRLGVGRALLDAATHYARALDAKGLQLSTAIDNTAAQALYEAEGWVRDTEFYDYYRILKAGGGL